MLLFSYGTLQDERVQLATFGRRLRGSPDQLVGFVLSSVPIEDPHAAAAAGRTHHANVTPGASPDSRVSGTAFEVTEGELTAADRYEADADYVRVTVELASGRPAWVYVHAGTDRSRGARG